LDKDRGASASDFIFCGFSLESGNPAKLLQPQMSLASRDLLYRFMLS